MKRKGSLRPHSDQLDQGFMQRDENLRTNLAQTVSVQDAFTMRKCTECGVKFDWFNVMIALHNYAIVRFQRRTTEVIKLQSMNQLILQV